MPTIATVAILVAVSVRMTLVFALLCWLIAGGGDRARATTPPTTAAPSVPSPAPPQKPIKTPQPASTDAAKTPLPISLRQCLEWAFESNLDLAIDRISPLEARSNTLSAQGAFDPTFNLNGSYGENRAPNASYADNTYISRSSDFSASLNQLLPSGTTVGVTSSSSDDVNTGNAYADQWNSFTGLTLSQPLLHGFGTDVNEAAIRIARRDEAGADATLEFQVDQVIGDVANAYYELIYARANHEALQESLELAEQLRSDNQERVKIGTMSPLDVSQANSEVAARRQDLLIAERTIQDDENALRILIAKDVVPLLPRRLIPTDLPPDNWDPIPLRPDINTALQNRADLRQARELLAHNRLTEAFRKNQLLPSLGVNGALGYNGQSENFADSQGRVVRLDDTAWSVGVSLSIPIGNRNERGQYEFAQYETIKQKLILHQLEQNVIIQTDNTGGQVETNRQRIIAARVARQLAEETLNAEQEKLKAGVSTSYTVLQLQRDLRNARITELRAIADFQKSESDLMRVEGLARSHFNIELRGAAE